MVGSELNPTQGKREGKLGDIAASSFPSSVTPSLRSKRFREYFRAVFHSRSSFFAPKPHGSSCFGG